jgi:glycosyltransferase involved in cell wall biosynthesis
VVLRGFHALDVRRKGFYLLLGLGQGVGEGRGGRDDIPSVLIEAYASGVPTIATALPAIVRLVGATQASLLVPPDDPVALANAIERVCTEPRLADSLQQRGRALVRSTFDQSRTTALLYDCFVRHAHAAGTVERCEGSEGPPRAPELSP